jgi:hypothetical protein
MRGTGVFAGYTLDENNSVQVGYVSKNFVYPDDQKREADNFEYKPDKMYTVRGNFKPLKNLPTTIGAEYASGQEGRAYQVEIDGNHEKTYYNLNMIKASPLFYGYYNNSNIMSGYFTRVLSEKMRFSMNYNKQESNPSYNPYYHSAPTQKSYSAGVQYDFSPNTSLHLEQYNEDYQDVFSSTNYNYARNSSGARLSHVTGNMTYSLMTRLGNTVDNLAKGKYPFSEYTLSTSYKPGKAGNVNLYVKHNNEGGFQGTPSRKIAYGLNSSLGLGENTNVRLNLARDTSRREIPFFDIGIYPDRWVLYNRDLFDIQLTRRLGNGRAIILNGRRAAYRSNDDSEAINQNDYMISYSFPFNIPIGRRKDIGFLQGRVFDVETEKGIEGAIVRVGDNVIVTGKDGNFNISLKPGDYKLSVDRQKLGLDRTTVALMPVQLAIAGGLDKQVDIEVIRSGEINGRIMVYKFEQGLLSAGKDLVESHPLTGGLLELTDGNETRRATTDNNGVFSFKDLPPRNWKLKLYNEILPEYHYFEMNEKDFTVNKGDVVEFHLKALPRLRDIKMLEILEK